MQQGTYYLPCKIVQLKILFVTKFWFSYILLILKVAW